MAKKSQIQANVIIYILAVVIGTAILLFGYKAIKNMAGMQEDIIKIDFKNKFQHEIELKANQFRNVNTLDFVLPKEFKMICMVDHFKTEEAKAWAEQNNLTMIKNILEDDVAADVFLLKDNVVKDMLYTGALSLDDPLECIAINSGYLSLKFEALGRRGVKVNEAS